MDKNKDKKRTSKENLRFVILNDDTLKEKFSRRVNLNKLYLILGAFVLALFVIFFLILSFTPMRHLIPGYGNIENNSYVIKINRYVSELESKIEAQELYNKSLRKILVENNFPPSKSKIDTEEKTKTNAKEKSKDTAPQKKEIIIYTHDYQHYDFSLPLNGQINKTMDVKTGHYGIDIAGTKNSAIKSIMDGTVIFSDWSIETGYTVIVEHAHGITSVYKHNSQLFKEVGDFVKKDESLGTVGNTGTLSSGPHLHFELWFNGIPKDPMHYLPFK